MLENGIGMHMTAKPVLFVPNKEGEFVAVEEDESDMSAFVSGLLGPSSTDMVNNFVDGKIAEKKLRRKRRRAALKGWRTRRKKRK